MSLQLTDPRYVPAETVRIARAAFPKGNLAMSLRTELEGIYSDELFEGCAHETKVIEVVEAITSLNRKLAPKLSSAFSSTQAREAVLKHSKKAITT